MSSRFWVLSNDDSRAPFFRERYAKGRCGRWISGINGWIWVPCEEKPKAKPEVKKSKTKFKK